jgi:hypothetical protein
MVFPERAMIKGWQRSSAMPEKHTQKRMFLQKDRSDCFQKSENARISPGGRLWGFQEVGNEM